MALVDELLIHAEAGDGGDGVARWLHLKGKEFSGPAGGDGGKGGDVYIEAIRDIGALARYAGRTRFVAEHGEDGQSFTRHGKAGKDLIIELPVGAVVTNISTGEQFDLVREGQRELILHGGRGGLGNPHFKSSTNTTPLESTPGKDGEKADFSIELRLIADVGLIGLPNAGKTSLLNALTRARGKVGAYPFTTLEPNLGSFYGYIVADIPGLIEGAAEGKGLGHKFLRHIRRTRVLVHCISLESEDVVGDYKTIREELRRFDQTLLIKPEMVVLTKSDLLTEEAATEKQSTLRAFQEGAGEVISVLNDEQMDTFINKLRALLQQ